MKKVYHSATFRKALVNASNDPAVIGWAAILLLVALLALWLW